MTKCCCENKTEAEMNFCEGCTGPAELRIPQERTLEILTLYDEYKNKDGAAAKYRLWNAIGDIFPIVKKTVMERAASWTLNTNNAFVVTLTKKPY